MPAPTAMRPRDVDALPASAVTRTVAYGTDPLQIGDLRLPPGPGPFAVVVVVHGGCWTKGFATRTNTAPLASALTEHGLATWNIEYRQVGDPGGGWPGTFDDWAHATDFLRVLARSEPLDLARVAVAGHSAGGHAAAWLASRPGMPQATELRGPNPLPVRAAVVIDGPPVVSAFIGLDAEVCGKSVIVPLMGGTPAEVPARYASANVGTGPMPPQLLVASDVLEPGTAERYRAHAPAGNEVTVLAVHDAGHFALIAPGSGPWKEQVSAPLFAFLDAKLAATASAAAAGTRAADR